MHIINSLAICLLIAGCATPEPIIKVVTQRVEIPVAVPCKEVAPAVPDFCFAKLNETNNIYETTRCLLSDRKLSIGYEIELVAKLEACK